MPYIGIPLEDMLAKGGVKDAKKAGVEKGKTFMVGDTEIDILAAENAGVNAIGVLTGLSYWRNALEKYRGKCPILGSVAEIDVERDVLKQYYK